ncbi:hypothetical protein [Terasakiella sp.]|uniref:hypothetical protein n=1 Tax=Terasakiella sp. TaxID=2034861 RepID=UPI003AA99729
MFNTQVVAQIEDNTLPRSRLLKSYLTQAHTLIRPDYSRYRLEFRDFPFYVVTPTFETQVIEVPDFENEPDLSLLDINNLESHREKLRLWLFWIFCQSIEKKDELADKAKHIADLYLRISQKPTRREPLWSPCKLRQQSSSRHFNPDNITSRHFCYQIALIAQDRHWVHPKWFDCLRWAEEELLRINHVSPDITYKQTEFIYTVLSSQEEVREFNQHIEDALCPYFAELTPMPRDLHHYYQTVPANIPRPAITREEFFKQAPTT